MPWLDKDIADLLSAPLSPPEMGAIYFAQAQLLENKMASETQTKIKAEV